MIIDAGDGVEETLNLQRKIVGLRFIIYEEEYNNLEFMRVFI